MTERHLTVLICDRCGDEFERVRTTAEYTRTCRYGVFVLRNGSGSKHAHPTRGDLDKDLCEPCTDGLLNYLAGKEATR